MSNTAVLVGGYLHFEVGMAATWVAEGRGGFLTLL